MLRPDELLGVIDFQDAVKALPLTIWCLCCAIAMCAGRKSRWMSWRRFIGRKRARWGCTCRIGRIFQQDFDYMGLQRHLKARRYFLRVCICAMAKWLPQRHSQYLPVFAGGQRLLRGVGGVPSLAKEPLYA